MCVWLLILAEQHCLFFIPCSKYVLFTCSVIIHEQILLVESKANQTGSKQASGLVFHIGFSSRIPKPTHFLLRSGIQKQELCGHMVGNQDICHPSLEGSSHRRNIGGTAPPNENHFRVALSNLVL